MSSSPSTSTSSSPSSSLSSSSPSSRWQQIRSRGTNVPCLLLAFQVTSTYCRHHHYHHRCIIILTLSSQLLQPTYCHHYLLYHNYCYSLSPSPLPHQTVVRIQRLCTLGPAPPPGATHSCLLHWPAGGHGVHGGALLRRHDVI